MTIYALTSLAGSPGVTTTAVAWATTSPTPTLLVEADMTGGSPILAGRFRSQVRHTKSLLSLVSHSQDREKDLSEAIRSQTVSLPGAVADSHLIPTIADHSQARLLEHLWPRLFSALAWLSRDTGTDVLVDLGRIGQQGSALIQALTQADAVIVLTHTTLPALVTTMNNLPGLQAQARGPLVASLIIESSHEGFPSSAVASKLPTPVVGTISHSPKAAAAYTLGAQTTPKAALRRYHAAIATIRDEASRQVLEQREALLGKEVARA